MQFELKYARADIINWLRWLNNPSGTPDNSWATWWASTSLDRYAQVSTTVRVVRFARISRLLIPICMLAAKAIVPKRTYKDGAIFWIHPAALIGMGVGLTIALQILTLLSQAVGCSVKVRAPQSGHGHGAPAASPEPAAATSVWQMVFFGKYPVNRLFHVLLVGLSAVACVVWLTTYNAKAQVNQIIQVLVAYFFVLMWVSRVIDIANIRWLKLGNRGVQKTIDVIIGAFLLGVQTLGAALMPFGKAVR